MASHWPQDRISYYARFLSSEVLERHQSDLTDVTGVPGLRSDPSLQKEFPDIETPEALRFTCDVYDKMCSPLREVLAQRDVDRAFLAREGRDSVERNFDEGLSVHSPSYQSPIGRADNTGRIPVGPRKDAYSRDVRLHTRIVEIPDFLEGSQVTLFGPPGTTKMSINAMNALHRALPNEPDIVRHLVEISTDVPRWGADNEDSKTPIMRDFLAASRNLIGCYSQEIAYQDPDSGKSYTLAKERLSLPIKRIPGLALPDAFHLYHGHPLPLHLYDFAMHAFHNWKRPQAMVFYVPKLESEDEARYLKLLISTTEEILHNLHPSYQAGTVKLFIVFETPGAIFRIREIAHELHPYFVGGSLGWHDFLASTAKLFRFDPNYRIPVKADPNIVIHHIRESHQILATNLDPIGALKIGGMYGVLYEEGNGDSFVVSMVGYIKDVITQFKRGLDGFWVAHPNFVRVGIALSEAWKRHRADPTDSALEDLITALVPDTREREPLLDFVKGPDVEGLQESDPSYCRGVLAANIKESELVSNSDPEEIRYNVFQALQYLTDWLCGNGCVALPATMKNASGNPVFVRVMDDLATTERSRWEVWAEIQHGRVDRSDFDSILDEEIHFIRERMQTSTKKTQVQWTGDATRWYPVAVKLLRLLILTPEPVDFVTELLLPFTLPCIREAPDPWVAAQTFEPDKYVDL